MVGETMTFGELLYQLPDAKSQIPPGRDLPITQSKYSAGLDWDSQQGTAGYRKHRHSMSTKVVTRGAAFRFESSGKFYNARAF